MKKAVLFTAIFVCSSRVFAQAADQWQSTQQMWDSLCQYCHETSIAVRLKGRQLPEQYTVYTVRHGRNAMPAFSPFQISDTELRRLAAWINRTAAEAAPEETSP